MESDLQQVNNQFILDLYNESGSQGLKWNDDDLLMIRESGSYASGVFMSGQPFQHSDTFVGIIMEGSFNCTINLQRHHITAGDILLVTPDSIMKAEGDAGGVQMQVLHVSDKLLAELFASKMPPIYHQRMKDALLHPSKPEEELMLSMFTTLWIAVHTEYKDNRNAELRNILMFICNMAVKQYNIKVPDLPRNVQIFNRFIQLVNENCEKHRDMEFYADKICLNKQYLSSIISEVSNRKASSWIEEALITRAKVLLRHEEMTVNEISDRLGFSEPSNMTRYFKRATGMTPLEYRNSK